jgi:hypothetical protein
MGNHHESLRWQAIITPIHPAAPSCAHLCVNRRLCNPPRNPALIIFASIDA